MQIPALKVSNALARRLSKNSFLNSNLPTQVLKSPKLTVETTKAVNGKTFSPRLKRFGLIYLFTLKLFEHYFQKLVWNNDQNNDLVAIKKIMQVKKKEARCSLGFFLSFEPPIKTSSRVKCLLKARLCLELWFIKNARYGMGLGSSSSSGSKVRAYSYDGKIQNHSFGLWLKWIQAFLADTGSFFILKNCINI